MANLADMKGFFLPKKKKKQPSSHSVLPSRHGHGSDSPLCRHPAKATGPHCTLVRLQAQPYRQGALSQAGVGGHVHIRIFRSA